jgi:hypothetical protein
MYQLLLTPVFFIYFYREYDSMGVPCKQLAYLAAYDIPDSLFAALSLTQHPTKGLFLHIDYLRKAQFHKQRATEVN